MPFELDIVYLLILIAVSLFFIIGLRALQKYALAELSKTLYEKNDPERYMQMLNSRFLVMVFRRNTIAMLRLDGALMSGSADTVWDTCSLLMTIKLRQSERLNWYQKAMSFAVTISDNKRAKEYLDLIDDFLEKESDQALQDVRTEAHLLYGIYIKKDTSLIPILESSRTTCKDSQLGLILYRLAKLYHYAGDRAKSIERLDAAIGHLDNSPWLDVAKRARIDTVVLESE